MTTTSATTSATTPATTWQRHATTWRHDTFCSDDQCHVDAARRRGGEVGDGHMPAVPPAMNTPWRRTRCDLAADDTRSVRSHASIPVTSKMVLLACWSVFMEAGRVKADFSSNSAVMASHVLRKSATCVCCTKSPEESAVGSSWYSSSTPPSSTSPVDTTLHSHSTPHEHRPTHHTPRRALHTTTHTTPHYTHYTTTPHYTRHDSSTRHTTRQ
mmetsp:Transcript_8512/g.18540  ORF Transcript_8512/g.18540 Transcript_8512/m.18540 type:complete len:213 (+) Transcript_8512:222-860(+)